MLILGGAGFAQKVQTFDEAPSIEQLRSIMIPESHAGAGRTIVIQRPNTGESPVQPASTQIVASPQASATANQPSPPQTVHAAATPSAVSHAAAPAPEASGAVAFYINFAFNSAVLPDSAHVMIDRIAQLMKEEPQVKLRVEGHTDAAGSADYNISLSEQRALSVAQYLEAHGIAPARLKLIGKGKTEPLTHDPYEAVNRRVQFVRIG
jgi:outer membrane protein OmpA-like peptidoglycan-associated protein